MAPFSRVSKVRSSIALNSAYVTLSVSYMVIWVPSGDLPGSVCNTSFPHVFLPRFRCLEPFSWCLENSRDVYLWYFFKEPRVIRSSQLAEYNTCHRVSFQENEFLISRFFFKVFTLHTIIMQSNPWFLFNSFFSPIKLCEFFPDFSL